MRPPYLFHRLEDSLPAVVGPSMVKGGTPTFPAVKFSNGAYSNNDANYVYFSSVPMASIGGLTETTVDFWLKSDWAMANGDPDGASYRAFISFEIDATHYVAVTAFDATYGIGIETLGTSGGNYTFYNTDANLDWSASTNTHFRIVWNASSSVLGGSYTMAMYVNGVLAGRTTTTPRALTGTGTIGILVYRPAFGGGLNFGGAIDNLKIFPYATVDFTNGVYSIHSERSGLNDLIS